MCIIDLLFHVFDAVAESPPNRLTAIEFFKKPPRPIAAVFVPAVIVIRTEFHVINTPFTFRIVLIIAAYVIHLTFQVIYLILNVIYLILQVIYFVCYVYKNAANIGSRRCVINFDEF